MTKKIAEYGHFKKINIPPEELNKFHEHHDSGYNLELKRKVQKIFQNGGIKIGLDEIFTD